MKKRILSVFCVLVMVMTGFAVIVPINVAASDTDGDGLSDWDEINVYGSNFDDSNTDWPADEIDDGNLDFDTSRVWICDQEPNTILETVPMSRSEITSSGEAMQNPLLVYQNDREKENIEFMEQLTNSPSEINMLETVPQKVDQNQCDYTGGGGTGGKLAGQSFVPSQEELSSIDLFLRRSGNPPLDDISVEIRTDVDNFPSEDVLGTAIVSNADVPPSPGYWMNFDFNPDISVSPETTYWIVVDLGYNGELGWISRQYTSYDSYPDGEEVCKWPDGWQYTGFDMTFRTYYLHYPQLVDQSQIYWDQTSHFNGLPAQCFVSVHDKLASVSLILSQSNAPIDGFTSVEIRGYNPIPFPPTYEILTSASISNSEIPINPDWVNFDFPDITVTPGERYWIVADLDVDVYISYTSYDSYPYGGMITDWDSGWTPPYHYTWDFAFRSFYLYNQQVPDQIQPEWDYMQTGSSPEKWAQSFISDCEILSSIDVCLLQNGNPLNDFGRLEIRNDDGGYPSDDPIPLTSAEYVSLDDILGSENPTWVNFDFPDITLAPETTYWIVLELGPWQSGTNHNDFAISRTDIYPWGNLLYFDGYQWMYLPNWEDMTFITNYPYNTPTGEISINYIHKIESDMGVTPTLQSVDEYVIQHWAENPNGPQNVIVASQELFMPYAATYAHRTYSAYVNDLDKALSLFKTIALNPYPHPLTITYFGDDPVMESKLFNLALLYSIPFQVYPTITDSEIALTPVPLLATHQIHTHSAVTAIHSKDNSDYLSTLPERQFWKIAPIYCAMRQTLLITVSGNSVDDIESSLTNEIENNIMPYNDNQIPDYLIICGHWDIFKYRFNQKWVDSNRDLTFVTYGPLSQIDQSQTAVDGYYGSGSLKAQSFTPTLDTLTSLDLYLYATNDRTDYITTVEIRTYDNEWPSNTVLTSASKTNAEISSTPNWINFDFPDIDANDGFIPGNKYWIVISTAPNTGMGMTFYDSYPNGKEVSYVGVNNYVCADYIYADLEHNRYHYLPDMNVGRLTSYSVTTLTLMINRGSFFDADMMIEGYKAVLTTGFDSPSFPFTQMEGILEQIYGTGNVWAWDYGDHGAMAPLNDVLNEATMAEFVYLLGHANPQQIQATSPTMFGSDILNGGPYPPSMWLFNGCSSGIYWGGATPSLVEGATRSGAVNVISTIQPVFFSLVYEYLCYLEQGDDQGTAWKNGIYEAYGNNINVYLGLLKYYSIGDPMVNYEG